MSSPKGGIFENGNKLKSEDFLLQTNVYNTKFYIQPLIKLYLNCYT